MTRLGIVFWLLLVLASGFTTFKVKYAVQDIEDELSRVRRQTIAEQQEIRVLTAEWTYLNQPERLAELNRRFLGLAPIGTKQLQQRIEDIPLRPPPAPPDVVIGADVGPGPAAAPAVAATLTVMPATITAVPAKTVSSEPAKAAPAAAAGSSQQPGSLDALIAQITDAR